MIQENTLEKIIYWCMVGFIFLVPLTFDPYCYDSFELPKVTLLRILTLIIIFSWIIKLLQKRKNKSQDFSNNILYIPVIFFVLILIIGTIFSKDILSSLKGTYRREEGLLTILNYIFVFFISINSIKENRQRDNLIIFSILAGTTTSIYAIFQHFEIDIFQTSFGAERSFSTLNHPNFLSAYLVMIIPLSLGRFLEEKNYYKILYLISFLIMYVALLFTYCRGAWLGFIFSLIILGIFIKKDVLKENAKYILISFILMIFLTFLSNRPFIRKNSFSLAKRVVSTIDVKDSTVAARLTTWRSALRIIRDYPLIGTGLDSFKVMFPQYKYADYVKYEGLHITADKTHNETLHLASTLGLIGLFIYFWILITFSLKLLNLIHKDFSVLKVSLFSSFIAYLVQNQFCFSVITTGMFFWMIMGMALAEPQDGQILLNKEKQKKKKKKVSFTPLSLQTYLILLLAFILLNILVLKPYIADHYFLKGYAAQQRQNFDKAIHYYEKAISINGWEEHYYIRLGESLEEKIKENKIYLEDAITAYEKATSLGPLNAYNYSKLGKIYATASRIKGDKKFMDKSLEAVKFANKLDLNNPVFYNNLGAIYNDRREPEKAIPYLKKALELDPKYIFALNNIGTAYGMTKRFKEAEIYFKRVLELDKKNITAHYSLGMTYYDLKRKEEAKREFEKTLELDPNHSHAQRLLEMIKNEEKYHLRHN